MKVEHQGREVEATGLDFFTRKEDFNEYLLQDGTVIIVKTVVTDILRLEGEVDSEGRPVYRVWSDKLVRIKK